MRRNRGSSRSTQATEVGTVYSVAELAAIADAAHELGMLLHVDGARLANAAASLGVGFGEMTTDAGVDAVSFGATKNGGLVGDVIVFLREGLAPDFEWIRKQGMQLASKTRFISAQLEAMLGEGDLWRRTAEHANEMALRLASGVTRLDGVELDHPVEANGVFARVPRAGDRAAGARAARRPPLLRLGGGAQRGPLALLLGHDAGGRGRAARAVEVSALGLPRALG